VNKVTFVGFSDGGGAIVPNAPSGSASCLGHFGPWRLHVLLCKYNQCRALTPCIVTLIPRSLFRRICWLLLFWEKIYLRNKATQTRDEHHVAAVEASILREVVNKCRTAWVVMDACHLFECRGKCNTARRTRGSVFGEQKLLRFYLYHKSFNRCWQELATQLTKVAVSQFQLHYQSVVSENLEEVFSVISVKTTCYIKN